MIKYQLICDLAHEFEGWFQTGADFDAQEEAGLVTCPVCDSVKVRRALMTPNLASPKRRRDDMGHLSAAETAHQLGTITPSSQATSGQTEFAQTASAHVAASKPDPSKVTSSRAALGEAKFVKCIMATANLKIFLVIQALKNANHWPMKALIL
jgi:hypothetical protein